MSTPHRYRKLTVWHLRKSPEQLTSCRFRTLIKLYWTFRGKQKNSYRPDVAAERVTQMTQKTHRKDYTRQHTQQHVQKHNNTTDTAHYMMSYTCRWRSVWTSNMRSSIDIFNQFEHFLGAIEISHVESQNCVFFCSSGRRWTRNKRRLGRRYERASWKVPKGQSQISIRCDEDLRNTMGKFRSVCPSLSVCAGTSFLKNIECHRK